MGSIPDLTGFMPPPSNMIGLMVVWLMLELLAVWSMVGLID